MAAAEKGKYPLTISHYPFMRFIWGRGVKKTDIVKIYIPMNQLLNELVDYAVEMGYTHIELCHWPSIRLIALGVIKQQAIFSYKPSRYAEGIHAFR